MKTKTKIETQSPRAETGEGLKGVAWEDYWALAAQRDELLAALKALVGYGDYHFDTCPAHNWIKGSEERDKACNCGMTQARTAIARVERGSGPARGMQGKQ